MRLFSEEQVRQAIKMDDLIHAIREAFVRGFAAVRMPPRTMLEMDDAILLVMPCYDSAMHTAGVKLVSVSAKARVQAAYELLDPQTGIALARMEANYLTDLRTAATSAVATDLLARTDVETLGIFGSGRLAVAHLAALPRVRNFRRFLVCGSGRSDVAAFCFKIKVELGVNAVPASAEMVARESDVLCTCTPSPIGCVRALT
jgi:ornithine cyclodeaminase